MADNVKTQVPETPDGAPSTVQDSAPGLHRYRLAFERALPASQALETKDLIPINIDLPTAIASTLGKLPGIMALRDRAKALPELDIAAFDELETLVLATAHAHVRYMGASAEPEAILELNERGMHLRNTLYADAVALATRNLINGDRIGEFKAHIGYKNLAFDLMALAASLRDNWDKVSSKTAITPEDLDQAELLGDQLINAIGVREQSPSSVADIAAQRQRNFTLFVNAYDEVRRALSFLRWKEDDVEHIAPSLYAGRGNSNARKKGTDDHPTPEQPAPNSPNALAAGTAGTAGGPTTTPPAQPANAVPEAAPGMPGASPFVNS